MADELQQSDETVLVLLAQQGDGEAFRALVEMYDRRLLYFVRRILNETDEAFDVVQSVWLCVHRSLRKLSSPRAFRVWLYQIAHNQAISVLRKSRREVPLDDVPVDEVLDAEQPDLALEAAELVHAALPFLSLDHRRVLTLRFLENMSVEEIAGVVGCGVGTIQSRLHYARLALRRRIEEADHE